MMKTTQLPLVKYYQAIEEVNLLMRPEKLKKNPVLNFIQTVQKGFWSFGWTKDQTIDKVQENLKKIAVLIKEMLKFETLKALQTIQLSLETK